LRDGRFEARRGTTMSRGKYLDHDRRTASYGLFCLVTALLMVIAGCASVPSYRANAALPQRKGGIKKVGLLPPVIAVSEEQPRFGLNKLVYQVLWSNAAVEAVSRTFSEEMAAEHVSLVPISAGDAEAKDLADLYNAVEFSIQRHAWEKKSGEFVPREPFPEKVRSFDYSLGPAAEFMDRFGVDAVWIVRGFNLLPTTGARAKEGAEVLLSILAALGGHAAPVIQYKRVELRVALVDRNGTILYFGVADEGAGSPAEERPARAASMRGPLEPPGPEENMYLAVDLRDPRVARYFIRAALSGYRKEATR
jgi:hypothetical protein